MGAKLLGVRRFESSDQERDAGVGAEGDDLLAVVTGGDGALPSEFLGLGDQGRFVLAFDGGEGVAVGLRDPEGVVVEFAGEARLLGRDLNGAVNAVGVEEGLLTASDRFGHAHAPMEECHLSVGTRMPRHCHRGSPR